MTGKTLIVTGAILGLTGIILGAFGAHALKKTLDASQLAAYETGIKYQMYHALFLLVVGNMDKLSERFRKWIFYLVLIGVLLFSGSIYLLSTRGLTGIDITSIGIITPIGGAMLIIAWILLLIDFMRQKS